MPQKKDFCSPVPLGSLGERVVEASFGVRLSNMCNAPNFEDVEGYIGLGLSMGQPICPSVRGLRLHSFENHSRKNLGIARED